MNEYLFYLFGAITVLASIMILFFRNPVTAAMSMVVSFLSLAVIYIGLDAHFLGIIQILVYTGAIMILFSFIIMLLNVKTEEKMSVNRWHLLGGLVIVFLFIFQFTGIMSLIPTIPTKPLNLVEAATKVEPGSHLQAALASGDFADSALIARALFSPTYAPTFILVGLILVVASVGVVAISRHSNPTK